MTNSVAVALAVFVAAFFAANAWFGWEAHVFLGRRLADAIAWLAFWR